MEPFVCGLFWKSSNHVFALVPILGNPHQAPSEAKKVRLNVTAGVSPGITLHPTYATQPILAD